jgi:hypothetical protein
MTARGNALFPGLTSVYLRSIGELMLCASRLENPEGLPGEAWRERAGELIDEANRLASAVGSMRPGRAPTVMLADGTVVVADHDYVEGLVRRMHRHHAASVALAAHQADRGAVEAVVVEA